MAKRTRNTDRRISALVTELIAASDRMTATQRAMRDRHVADVFPSDIEQLIEELIPVPKTGVDRELSLNLRKAVKAGFVLALARYSSELRMNAEALKLINARKRGGVNGREKSSQNREQRAQRIRDTWAAMEAAGQRPTNQAVAAAVGCGVSTVIRAFKSKPANRTRR